MKLNRSSILPALLLLLATVAGFRMQAQPGVYYETVEPGAFFICAWETSRVHEYPNLGSSNVGTIFYTEEVRHLGREAFVRSENRNYVFVETEDGAQGWVNEAYLVQGGGAIVILEEAQIFSRPNTTTAITNQHFASGEIAILSEFKDGWVKLTGQQKQKEGWVQGYDRLSVEQHDIEAATLLAKALAMTNQQDQLRELREIRGGRSYLSPEMQIVIDQSISSITRGGSQSTPSQPYNGPVYYDEPAPQPNYPSNNTTYYANGEDAFSNSGSSTYNSAPRGSSATNTPADVQRPAPTPVNPYAYQEREVVDMATGRSYIRVKESGTIQPVKANNPSTSYYAYHKSVPIGSKILLSVPGTDMYVELEVIARLRSDNPNMVGLGAEVIKAVFGEIAAKDVGSVTIEYPKP